MVGSNSKKQPACNGFPLESEKGIAFISVFWFLECGGILIHLANDF